MFAASVPFWYLKHRHWSNAFEIVCPTDSGAVFVAGQDESHPTGLVDMISMADRQRGLTLISICTTFPYVGCILHVAQNSLFLFLLPRFDTMPHVRCIGLRSELECKKKDWNFFCVLFVHYRAGLANIASCMQNVGEDKGRFQHFCFCFCCFFFVKRTFSALWETRHSRQFPLQVCHAEVIVQTWLWFAIVSSLVVSPINVGIRSLTLMRRQWPRKAKNKQEKSF